MSVKYEMSKTYQYRKVVKPLLERKRRARINKCLDDLKDLIGEFIQQENASSCHEMHVKLEKADILEVTVNHLRKLKAQRQQRQQQQQLQQHQQQLSTQQQNNSFRSGYIQAANEVSRCLASLPKINVAFGTKLMTHLGLRLNQLEQLQQQQQQQQQQPSSSSSSQKFISVELPRRPMSIAASMQNPLQINCQLQAQQTTTTATTIRRKPTTRTSTPTITYSCRLTQLHSPVSSGYASDSDNSLRSSPSLHDDNLEQLNKPTTNIWRPW